MSFLDVPGVKAGALDASIQAKIEDTGSATRGALNATILDLAVPRWKANTAYLAGAKVLSPSGDIVSAKVDFTSGASFSEANWDFILDTSQTAHMLQIIVASGSSKNGMRIVNNAATYALKLDQFGLHDAVNIAANFTGGHTPFSVNSSNTTLSTVKIVNAAAQTGGAVIVGVASDPTRTAQVIQADNYGSGASFLATQEPGATGIGLQIQFLDAGGGTTVYGSRALWIAGHHTSGSLAYIENDKIQTSGNLLQLVQSNASSTADCLVISPFGSGAGLRVNASGASTLIAASNFSVDANGGVRSPSIVNNASFSNSRVQLTTTGTLVDRTVADNNPVLRVQNSSATSTGDVLQAIGIAGLVGSRFNKNAYFITSKTAAPADADLSANDAALWYDSTNGAAKLMIKAKQANGTVVTGSVVLA